MLFSDRRWERKCSQRLWNALRPFGVRVRVVFVHGLTGNREATWTASGSAAPWPQALLPLDLPRARLLLYGYDADVVNFWSMASQNKVGDHRQKLRISLAYYREQTDSVRRHPP